MCPQIFYLHPSPTIFLGVKVKIILIFPVLSTYSFTNYLSHVFTVFQFPALTSFFPLCTWKGKKIFIFIITSHTISFSFSHALWLGFSYHFCPLLTSFSNLSSASLYLILITHICVLFKLLISFLLVHPGYGIIYQAAYTMTLWASINVILNASHPLFSPLLFLFNKPTHLSLLICLICFACGRA